MAKEGRRRPNSPATASFYKIILPSTLVNNKLRIPEKFMAAHGHELSTIITLTIPDGCSWKVEMEKAEEMIWFSDGWQKLVDHYSISPGDFLIFKYQGCSTFSVFIFDMTSTEIHYPNRTLTSSAPPDNCPEWLTSNEEETDGHDSLEILGSQENECVAVESNLNENDASTSRLSDTIGKPRAAGNNGLQANNCEFVDLEKYVGIRNCFTNIFVSKLTSQEKERAIQADRLFTSKNPTFMVIISQSNLRPAYFLGVPAKFCESYMNAPGIKVELEVSDERWSVSAVRRSTRSLSLSKGWAAFANENCLSIGDICVFELVQIKNIVLKVSIFRANEDGNKHATTKRRST